MASRWPRFPWAVRMWSHLHWPRRCMWQDHPWSVLGAGISKPLWDLLKACFPSLRFWRGGMLLFLWAVKHLPKLHLEGTQSPTAEQPGCFSKSRFCIVWEISRPEQRSCKGRYRSSADTIKPQEALVSPSEPADTFPGVVRNMSV